jgi:hypothetical protein
MTFLRPNTPLVHANAAMFSKFQFVETRFLCKTHNLRLPKLILFHENLPHYFTELSNSSFSSKSEFRVP